MRIAMLDDEPREIESIQRAMAVIGHECHGFANGKSLLRGLRAQPNDLLVLDRPAPDVEGIEVVRRLRESFGNRLALLLAPGPDDKARMTTTLLAGADNFMVKAPGQRRAPGAHAGSAAPGLPDPLRERTGLRPVSLLTAHQYDPPARRTGAAEAARVHDLAVLLLRNIGRLLSREHLMQATWGQELGAGSRSLDTHVSRLRARLELRPGNGVVLASVYGLGYRLEFLSADDGAGLPYPLAGAAE